MTDTADTPLGTSAAVGGPGMLLTDAEVATFVGDQLDAVDLDGARVCILVPDRTRACPLPGLLRTVDAHLTGRADFVTVLVALGTHAPLDPTDLASHVGLPGRNGLDVRNHEW